MKDEDGYCSVHGKMHGDCYANELSESKFIDLLAEDKTMNAFTSAIGGLPMTIEVLKEAMAKLAAIPKNDQWLVVTPEGEIYQGTVTQVLPVLLERHPLHKTFKFPIQFNETA